MQNEETIEVVTIPRILAVELLNYLGEQKCREVLNAVLALRDALSAPRD